MPYQTSLLGHSVQFSHSVMSDSLRLHGLQRARPPCPSPTPGVYSNSCPLSVMPSNHLILCHPLLLLPSIFPSKWVSSSHQVAKILEFHLQHQSFQWIFRTDFLRMDWLDLLAVQRTLKSLLQHWSSALIRQTLVGKVMSLLFNMLSSLVVAFLPRSKCLLISWLLSPSAVILEPPKINSLTVSIVSASICTRWRD